MKHSQSLIEANNVILSLGCFRFLVLPRTPTLIQFFAFLVVVGECQRISSYQKKEDNFNGKLETIEGKNAGRHGPTIPMRTKQNP